MTKSAKFYMACDSQEQLRAEYGPFKTYGEAEKQARILGFKYVLVYTHVIDVENDDIVEVQQRFSEIAPSIDTLRSVVSGVKPMNPDEEKFFAQYEEQMTNHLSLWERIKKAIQTDESVYDQLNTEQWGGFGV